MKSVLGIDPGSHCGWAVLNVETGAPLAWGHWELKGGRFEGFGMRFIRLTSFLKGVHGAYPEIQLVAMEEVRRHMGVDAAHIYGGVVAHVAAFCEESKLPYLGIPVGTVKKRATGSGNASKEAMIAAVTREWPSIKVEDDNEADALWIARTAIDQKA